MQAGDYTLRDYWYLMRPEENWAKLAWNVDREYFLDCLDKAVEIRNDLMHFTTDDVDRPSTMRSKASSKCSGRSIPGNELVGDSVHSGPGL